MGFLYGVTRIKQGVPKAQDDLFVKEDQNDEQINAQKPDPTKPTRWTIAAAIIDGLFIVGLIGAGTVFLMNASGALTISVHHGLSLILGGSLTGTGVLFLGFDLITKMKMDSKLASVLFKQQNKKGDSKPLNDENSPKQELTSNLNMTQISTIELKKPRENQFDPESQENEKLIKVKEELNKKSEQLCELEEELNKKSEQLYELEEELNKKSEQIEKDREELKCFKNRLELDSRILEQNAPPSFTMTKFPMITSLPIQEFPLSNF